MHKICTKKRKLGIEYGALVLMLLSKFVPKASLDGTVLAPISF